MKTNILLDNFINIDNKYYGGAKNLIRDSEKLFSFNLKVSSGIISLADLLIYEFSKYSDTLGTVGNLNLELEIYENLLRNYIDRDAYRKNGFISVDGMKRYILDFSRRRKIDIKTNVYRDFTSKTLFIDIIKKGLENNHPLILQSGYKRLSNIDQYVIITGITDDSFYISNNGKRQEYKISDLFNFSDPQLSLFYIEIKPNRRQEYGF